MSYSPIQFRSANLFSVENEPCIFCSGHDWNFSWNPEIMHNATYPCESTLNGKRVFAHFAELVIAIESGLTLDGREITQNFDHHVQALAQKKQNKLITALVSKILDSKICSHLQEQRVDLRARLRILRDQIGKRSNLAVFKQYRGQNAVYVFQNEIYREKSVCTPTRRLPSSELFNSSIPPDSIPLIASIRSKSVKGEKCAFCKCQSWNPKFFQARLPSLSSPAFFQHNRLVHFAHVICLNIAKTLNLTFQGREVKLNFKSQNTRVLINRINRTELGEKWKINRLTLSMRIGIFRLFEHFKGKDVVKTFDFLLRNIIPNPDASSESSLTPSTNSILK